MEIKEIVTFYINETSQTMDVTFRTINDGDDEIRTDQIVFDEIENFGYVGLVNKLDDFSDLDDEDSELDDFDLFYDEDLDSDVISFLNEYYLVYPNKLPKSEFF